jgi:hypothetical protein
MSLCSSGSDLGALVGSYSIHVCLSYIRSVAYIRDVFLWIEAWSWMGYE